MLSHKYKYDLMRLDLSKLDNIVFYQMSLLTFFSCVVVKEENNPI